MITFLHGEDAFLVGRRRRALQEAFLQKNPQVEVAIFDFEDERSPEFVRRALEACAGGLFAQVKMVVFLNVMLLEGEGASAVVDLLKSGTLAGPNQYVFVQPGKIKKTHAAVKALLKWADSVEDTEAYTMLRGSKKVPDTRKLEQFVRSELKSFGHETSMAPEALRVLVAATGADTARLASEVEKLATFKAGGTIEAADVTQLCETSLDEDIFRALDAIVGNRKDEALRLFRLYEKKGDVYGSLGMCAWQVRRLIMVREAYDNGMRSFGDIARDTKLAPFVVEKSLARIEQFPMARLKSGLALLSQLDLEIKQGETAPEIALDLFIWKF